MAKLPLIILVVGIVCGVVLANREEKQFVVEEGVYEDVGTPSPEPPPPKQCPEMMKLESLVGLFERTQNWVLLVEVDDIYTLADVSRFMVQTRTWLTKATVGGVPPFSLVCLSHSHE